MDLINQTQVFNNYRYKVTDLIFASKELEVFELKVKDVFIDYEAPNENSLASFIEHVKDVNSADLSHPIILTPCNFILDGKHRLAKAILTGEELIKAVRFASLPNCGVQEED